LQIGVPISCDNACPHTMCHILITGLPRPRYRVAPSNFCSLPCYFCRQHSIVELKKSVHRRLYLCNNFPEAILNMSKVDKPVKQSTSSQLKKELNQASKVIQNLANSLERLESNLSDAETSLIRERLLKEELSSTKEEIKALQEAQYKVQKERQEEIALFADVNLKLTGEFQERLTKSQLQYESRLKDCQRREELVEAKWKHNVDFEKAETSRLRELESRDRQEIKSQLQKAKEVWQKKEEQFNTNLRQRERQIAELSDKNKALIQELSEHETMLKGRDTEMQRLGGRLSALEAFPPQDVTDK
jgi:DNA repair exonuclease SbcCD ATPase subunit